MNAFPLSKFLTAVCFILVSFSAGAENSPTNSIAPNCNIICQNRSHAKYQECVDNGYCGGSDGSCNSAFGEWQKAAEEQTEACNSFKSSGSTCEKRVESCRRQISDSFSKSETSKDSLATNVVNMAYLSRGIDPTTMTQSTSQTVKNAPSCVSYSNDKSERRSDKLESKVEKIEDKIDRLRDKLKDEKEKINTKNADLRKDTADINKDIESVQKESKKSISDLNKKKTEDQRKIAQDAADNATAIRKASNEIIKLKEQAEQLKFDHAEAMLDFAQDKVSTRCELAVQTAAKCFKKAAKGDTSDKDCAGYNLSSKGVKGTTEMKKRLAQVQDACFEQANSALKRKGYETKKSLRSLETEITEKNKQIQDLQAEANRKQDELKTLNAETDKDISNEQTSQQQQLENLNKKLTDLTQSTQEAIALSNQNLTDIQKQIDDLTTKKLAQSLKITEDGNDIEMTFNEAESAIIKAENLRETASVACGCKTTSKDAKCSRLAASPTQKRMRSTLGGSGTK